VLKAEGIAHLSPSFEDWRTSHFYGMAPDRGFTKQLKMLRETYDVVWDRGSHKWEVWDFPTNGQAPYHVATVQTRDRSYRQVGQDVLLELQKGEHLVKDLTIDQLCNYFDEMDNQVRRRKAKEFSTKIQDFARDSFINIHCKLITVPREYSIARSVEV